MSPCFTRLAVILALGAGAVSAWAQQTIIYSKPAGIDSDKANSFMDTSRRLHAGDYKAPHSFLNVQPNIPLPPPSYQSTWDSSAIDAANKRNNWALLTPRQILGVKTPDEILGIKPKNDEGNLSLEERFLLRQQSPASGMLTNGGAGSLFLRNDSSPFWNNSQNGRQSAGSGSTDSRSYNAGQPDSFSSLRRLFNTANARNVSGGNDQNDQNQNSIWTSGFAQPPQPKVTPDQIAAMERFRALMAPNPAPAKPVTVPTYSSSKSDSSSFFDQQPNVNPAGRSYTSVESDIIRPKGLTPLPGITGPAPKPDNKRPAWKAQLPPWMSDGPQPFNPNRHF